MYVYYTPYHYQLGWDGDRHFLVQFDLVELFVKYLHNDQECYTQDGDYHCHPVGVAGVYFL